MYMPQLNLCIIGHLETSQNSTDYQGILIFQANNVSFGTTARCVDYHIHKKLRGVFNFVFFVDDKDP